MNQSWPLDSVSASLVRGRIGTIERGEGENIEWIKRECERKGFGLNFLLFSRNVFWKLNLGHYVI